MNTVCCSTEPGGVCANGFPTECSPPCAGIFGNFNVSSASSSSWLPSQSLGGRSRTRTLISPAVALTARARAYLAAG